MNKKEKVTAPLKEQIWEASNIWHHVKSGGFYTIIDRNALIEADLTRAVIYKSLWDGSLWVRPAEEFFDGRFEIISIDELLGKVGQAAFAPAAYQECVAWLAQHAHDFKPECLAEEMAKKFLPED